MTPPKIALTTFLVLVTVLRLSAQDTPRVINLGDLALRISTSWTAQVFHIVDQLSDWSPYSHHQYIRWARKHLEMTKEDSVVLQEQKMLRQAHSLSNDFDASYLTDGSVEEASAAAVREGRLSKAEATKEQAILLYYSKRLSFLKDTAASQAAAFFAMMASHFSEMTDMVKKLLFFTETQGKVRVPVFLVDNPEDGNGGGEANGGRLVIEMQAHPSPLPFVVHESLHFLLTAHLEQIKAAADSAHVDAQVVNEGIAYAMEGMLEDPDMLPGFLVEHIAQGKGMSDRYTQFWMAAIVFRPKLRAALEKGETFSGFLPKAIAAWKRVASPT